MRALLIAAWIATLAAAQAQAAPEDLPAAPMLQVETRVRDAILKSYREFMRGLDVFEKKHALAPDAAPLFRIVPAAKGVALDGVTMRVAGDTVSLQVPVHADGTFEMPRSQAALDEDAGIFVNKKRGTHRWRPHFTTPNLPSGTRRLGDLRLECEVIWAVSSSHDIVEPQGADSVGDAPCRSGALKVMQWSPRRILEYALVAGSRRQVFTPPPTPPDSPQPVYWVPLHDSSWPDDTLVEFIYAPQA